jgi:REP element-mobilizing transposase RayT
MGKQGSLTLQKSQKTFFGGKLLKKSHAKVARPLSVSKPMHLVLRSSQARGGWYLLHKTNVKSIRRVLKQQGQRFKVQVLSYKNAGNHLHLLIRGKTKLDIKNFLRTISALIARYVQRVHKGSAAQKSFWDQRPFTRIVEGYTGLRVAHSYIIQNELEALGVVPYVSSSKKKFSSA